MTIHQNVLRDIDELLVFTTCFAIVSTPDDMKVVTCKEDIILANRKSVCIQTSPTQILKAIFFFYDYYLLAIRSKGYNQSII